MALVVLLSLYIVLQAMSIRAEEANSLLNDIQEKLAMKLNEEHGGGESSVDVSLEKIADVLRRNDDNLSADSDSQDQSDDRLMKMLVDKRYHKHCGPQRLGEFCRSSNDCCCGYHCRKFKCREHFFG